MEFNRLDHLTLSVITDPRCVLYRIRFLSGHNMLTKDKGAIWANFRPFRPFSFSNRKS